MGSNFMLRLEFKVKIRSGVFIVLLVIPFGNYSSVNGFPPTRE
jgi:hypothetical protein